MSTTDNAVVASGTVGAFTDETLLLVEPGRDPRLWMNEGNWRALSSLIPTDIDALAVAPGFLPLEHRGLAFSLVSDQAPFRDGDVLLLGLDGVPSVYLSETTLAQRLGVVGTGLDVDAIAFDGSGRLLFSFFADADSMVLGPISNGDILRMEADGSIQRILTEGDVQAAFTAATGSTAAIGDVQGLEWHQGELWCVVQAPSSHDGGILRVIGAPGFVAMEGELGLGGAELDAIARIPAGADPFTLWFEFQGASTLGHLEGGTPGGLALVFASSTPGYWVDGFLGGFGAWYVNPSDPFLGALLAGPGPAGFVLDGVGSYTQTMVPVTLGAGLGHQGDLGWTYQALDVLTWRLSTPARLTL